MSFSFPARLSSSLVAEDVGRNATPQNVQKAMEAVLAKQCNAMQCNAMQCNAV
jgi:hypothetical protein